MHDFESLTVQQEIYDFIRKTIESRGHGPTVREVVQHFGMKSPEWPTNMLSQQFGHPHDSPLTPLLLCSLSKYLADHRREQLGNTLSRHFQPPYDSPLEELLAWSLSKYLAERVSLLKQVEAKTPCGTFYLDLVAENAATGRRIAFECDGKEFHPDKLRDECRDALILGGKHVETIYRFRGQDLYYHADDCLLYVAHKDPTFFSERGRINLSILGSDEMRHQHEVPPTTESTVTGEEHVRGLTTYYVDHESDLAHQLIIERHTLEGPPTTTLHRFLALAACCRGVSFAALVKRFRTASGHL
jgi:hypothetical protein